MHIPAWFLSGQVMRWHAKGDFPDPVSGHSWVVAMIIITENPDWTKDLIEVAMSETRRCLP